LWQTIGNAGGVAKMDIISSSPAIDFVNHAVWVTSRSAGTTAQPSLWKLNPNTGAVLTTAALGDTDTDPTLSIPGDVLFVANNAGTIFAINPATAATLKSVAGGDGAIVSFPIVLGLTSPYTVIFSGQTAVHAMKYDKTANMFTSLWSTTISGPSAPIGVTGGSKVYVGSADGKIHELDQFHRPLARRPLLRHDRTNHHCHRMIHRRHSHRPLQRARNTIRDRQRANCGQILSAAAQSRDCPRESYNP